MKATDLIDNGRIMELRLAYLKRSLSAQWGEEMSMRMLEDMANMFNANYSFLVPIFKSPNKIINQTGLSKERKYQEAIVMGEAYGYNRQEVAERFLDVSKGYIYSDKELFNPQIFLDEEWAEELDDYITTLGIPARYNSAMTFLMGLKMFMEVV